MTTLTKAAQELGKELFGPELQDDDVNIILRNLAPVQAELDKLQTLQFELASKRVDSLRLEQIVDEAHSLLPDYKGLPDPCDDASSRIRKAIEELDRLKREVEEAREFVKATAAFAPSSELEQSAKAWLERNP